MDSVLVDIVFFVFLLKRMILPLAASARDATYQAEKNMGNLPLHFFGQGSDTAASDAIVRCWLLLMWKHGCILA